MTLVDTPSTFRSLARSMITRERTAQLWLAGADLGNTTALFAVGDRFIQIPSLIGTGDLAALLATRGGAGDDGKLMPGEYAIEYQGQTWYIGQLAADQSTDATTDRGNPNRQASGHGLRLLLALVGVFDSEITAVRLRVVTGLPIRQFKARPDLRQAIAESLVGTHCYKFYDSTGVREMQVEVEACIVGMEGAMAAQAFGVPGKPSGFIDIGGDSFDVGWINAQGRLVEERTDSLLDAGAERIASAVSALFKKHYGRELTTTERAELLANKQRMQNTTVYEDGPRSITYDTVHEATRQAADRGDRFLQQKWGAKPGSDGAQVRLLGGAARLWRPHVYAELVVSDQPEADNVLAFAAFATRFDAAGKFRVATAAEVR